MKFRNDNMLLRIAEGDAYAICVEYVKEKEQPELYAQARKFECYLQHPTYKGLRPGMYSDDTQMSIAVAEALINDASGLYWENYLKHEQWFQHWFDTFKRDPRDGYSRGFQALLESSKTVDELRLMIKPDSTKNGAAMRSVPIGVMHNVRDMMMVAATQAATTHATSEGVTSSIAVALMSHYALYDHRGWDCMNHWCSQWLPLFEQFREPWVGRVTGKAKHSPHDVGINTAWAVHTLLTTKSSLMEIMSQVLDWGGDTDSVAAVAFGIASCRYQDEVFPEFLERDLELNNRYSVSFLKDIGKQLMDAYDV